MSAADQEDFVDIDEDDDADLLFETDLVHRGALPYCFTRCLSDADFNSMLKQVAKAIRLGVLPQRSASGTSGTYIIRNSRSHPLGIFKPKDEETYAGQNPRWGKWMQRWFCPIAFGRACLPPNQAYLSEVAASAVDRCFGFGIVPRTECVRIAASSLNYSRRIRARVEQKLGRGVVPPEDPLGMSFYPAKLGSLQVFVGGFREAGQLLKEWESVGVNAALDEAFQRQFERLVLLDYIIRNTDRGMDNWMVHVSWIRRNDASCLHKQVTNEAAPPLDYHPELYEPCVRVAAIDNGLAFPYKHPDHVRSYPYGWSLLPWTFRAFSEETRSEFLPMLGSESFWDDLVHRLRSLFLLDDDGFDNALFERQMQVMRGQMYNAGEALRRGESPKQLLERPWLVVRDMRQGRRQHALPLQESSETSDDASVNEDPALQCREYVRERPLLSSL